MIWKLSIKCSSLDCVCVFITHFHKIWCQCFYSVSEKFIVSPIIHNIWYYSKLNLTWHYNTWRAVSIKFFWHLSHIKALECRLNSGLTHEYRIRHNPKSFWHRSMHSLSLQWFFFLFKFLKEQHWLRALEWWRHIRRIMKQTFIWSCTCSSIIW